MKNETLTPPPTGTPNPKARNRETTAAGKVGDWQRLLAPLVANADDLKHLEIPRTQLAAMVSQAADLKKQQAAQRAAKQEASKQLQETITEGVRLANLLRQAVKQHYGIRAEKLAEFGMQPFRGRKPAPAPTTPSVPPPTVEVAGTPTAPASR
ncbi:MAG TPA: hypothetical protein VFE33_18615 [Thermoanaerobaculia bacterium]|nr:hypothetical protein [Thermoanaerobaculia bacterium]